MNETISNVENDEALDDAESRAYVLEVAASERDPELAASIVVGFERLDRTQRVKLGNYCIDRFHHIVKTESLEAAQSPSRYLDFMLRFIVVNE